MPRQKKRPTIKDLVALGYEAELAFEVDGVSVWQVDGFGISQTVRDDDAEALGSLADPKLQAERVKQAEAGFEPDAGKRS